VEWPAERLLFLENAAGPSRARAGTWINRLIEAKRFLAKNAILAVHSFSAQQDGFSHFQAFARQFGASVSNPGELVHAGTVSDVELFLGWAQGPVAVTPPTVG
jgi:hypothetical protein